MKEQLYPFTNASLAPSVAIGEYRLMVSGETLSLGQTDIHLVRAGEESGLVIFDVVGEVTAAIGSIAYHVSTSFYPTAGTEGVIVRGADDKQVRLDFRQPTIDATDDAHADDAASRTRLAGLDSATILPSSILLNPSLLQVVAQASGFNYDVKLVRAKQGPAGALVYLVIETQTGPDWPRNGGIGPVIPPVHLSQALPVGFDGTVAVVGKKHTIRLKA